MAQITAEGLVKVFHVAERAPGTWGAVRGLFARRRREVRALAVGVNPRPVALGRGGTLLAVGNLGSSDQSLIDLDSGREVRAEPAAARRAARRQ